MTLFLLDGTFTPFFFPDPLLFMTLEFITMFIEGVIFIAFNLEQPPEKRWKSGELFGIVVLANVVSMVVGLFLIILRIL